MYYSGWHDWRHPRHLQQRQQVKSNCILKSAKLCCGHVLKRSLSAHLMRVKLLLFTFYVNCGLHAVSIGKPSERMSKFWTVRFVKTESEPNFGFPHIHCTNRYYIVHLHRHLAGHFGEIWTLVVVSDFISMAQTHTGGYKSAGVAGAMACGLSSFLELGLTLLYILYCLISSAWLVLRCTAYFL